jgi:RimJ/RimL family protein N-acetyltransferase
MDPNEYVYDKERTDKNFDFITEREEWYPVVGIFLPDGKPIGNLSFKRINRDKSQCELGIMLVNDKYKGKGYGTEALRLAIAYITDTLKLKHIYADTMGSNIRMQRIFNKLGFELVGREEHVYDMHDRWEDKIDYILINNCFYEQ